MHTWVRTTVFKVATNTPNLMRRAVIKSHFHRADNSWTPTGRSTMRGACQLANSHHQRNYIHKHSLLFPQSAILTCCLPWLCNICCRSFHFYISQDLAARLQQALLSCLSSQNKHVSSTPGREWFNINGTDQEKWELSMRHFQNNSILDGWDNKKLRH